MRENGEGAQGMSDSESYYLPTKRKAACTKGAEEELEYMTKISAPESSNKSVSLSLGELRIESRVVVESVYITSSWSLEEMVRAFQEEQARFMQRGHLLAACSDSCEHSTEEVTVKEKKNESDRNLCV